MIRLNDRNLLHMMGLITVCLLCLLSGVFVVSQEVWAQHLSYESSHASPQVAVDGTVQVPSGLDDDDTVLELSATKTHYLPPAMYGRWQVHSTMVSNSCPMLPTAQQSRDTWVLERHRNRIFLENPVTRARADIAVDNVQGSRATFHHQVMSPFSACRPNIFRRLKMVMIEQPTVEVDGDIMRGQMVKQFDYYKNRELVARYQVVYDLYAHRLSGGRVLFGKPPEDQPTEFDIAPIQHEVQHAPSSSFAQPDDNDVMYVK